MEDSVIFSKEEQAVHQLILKAYALKEPGLFFGKMGVAIACFDYGKRSGNQVITDLGDDLIDGILEEVDYRTHWNFATGLCGIAWGIEYLMQHKYVQCNSNAVCGDLDKSVESVCIHRMEDLSIDTGIEGLLHYVLMRIKGSLLQNNVIPFTVDFLDDIYSKINVLHSQNVPDSLKQLIEEFIFFRKTGKIKSYSPIISDFIKSEAFAQEIKSAKTGLKNGLVGWLYAFNSKLSNTLRR